MQLENSFTMPAPIEDVWPVLLDLPRVAVCMPGAKVTDATDEDIVGELGIKLGPIRLGYAGKVRLVEKDDHQHRAVLSATANESRGGGTVAARIAAQVESVEGGSASTVRVVTDLDITGRPAQFGRGVMTDVGQRVMQQFAANLQANMSEAPAAASVPALAAISASPQMSTEPSSGVNGHAPVAAGNDLRLTDLLPQSVTTFAPVIAGTLAGVLVGWLMGGRPRRA